MSRMTKFLKQTCLFEAATRSRGGRVVLNDYGDIMYAAGIELPCRREGYERDIQTTNGAIVKCSSRYFLDDTTVVRVDDRIDGHVVLAREEYIDQFGNCIGYEAYV